MNSLFGLKVQVSPYATETRPVKPHRRRRNQSVRYHTRIQKKWRKRYGTKQMPGCYKLGDHTLIMHPEVYRQLREHAEKVKLKSEFDAASSTRPEPTPAQKQSFRFDTAFGFAPLRYGSILNIVNICSV